MGVYISNLPHGTVSCLTLLRPLGETACNFFLPLNSWISNGTKLPSRLCNHHYLECSSSATILLDTTVINFFLLPSPEARLIYHTLQEMYAILNFFFPSSPEARIIYHALQETQLFQEVAWELSTKLPENASLNSFLPPSPENLHYLPYPAGNPTLSGIPMETQHQTPGECRTELLLASFS